MNSFLNRMRDGLEFLRKRRRTRECHAISEVLEYRLTAASAAYWSTLDLENVEQLFSLAYAARDPVSKCLPVAMAATLDFCRQQGLDRKIRIQLTDPETARRLRPPNGAPDVKWDKAAPEIYHRLDDAVSEGQTTSHVAALLGMINQKSEIAGANTFISFNYDTLVEDALTRLDVPWHYGFSDTSMSGFVKDVVYDQSKDDSWGRSKGWNAVPVLKLHGSVNWTVDTAESPLGSQLKVFRSYDDLRAKQKRPRLIPPTWSKSVEDQLSEPWEAAIQRLRTATRVVIIGFSMPETDLHFRYLLAAGLQENAWLRNIVFVNPDVKAVEERARALLRASYIDQGLIRFLSLTSSEFANELLRNGRTSPSGESVDIGRYPSEKLGVWTSTT